MPVAKTHELFSPIELGATRLNHRVVMAPLTRSRSIQPDGIPSDLMLELSGRSSTFDHRRLSPSLRF